MTQPAAQTIINDRYLLVRLIGQGGMGTVHMASDLGHDSRPVALKRISPALVTPELIESFKAEFDAMTRLNHPNVVQVFDFGTERATGTHFLTMEYVDGGDLASAAAAWQDGSAPHPGLDALLDLIVQACRGLDYIHARGLVHNDLKLQNFLLTSTSPQVLKLSDFGLASRKIDHGPGMRGTMHYLAPETIQGAPPDRRTDLYAFGVAIYKLLTGRMPLEGNPNELLRMIASRLPDPPSSINPAIPASLDILILDMLAKDPARRPAGAAQVIAVINAATGRADSIDTPATIASYLSTARFVGRQSELEKLTRLLDAAGPGGSGGAVRLAMLSGESGVGKSRLLRRVQQEAQLRGGAVALGQCYPEAASPFHPFIQILGEVVGGATEDPDLKSLLTPLDQADAQAAPARGPDALRVQRRVADAAVRALVKTAQDGLLLLLIEDLQWADSASISLLEHLARNISDAPHMLVVATWRSEEADSPSLAAALERLERAGKWQRLELSRLRREDVSQMLAGMFGMEDAPRDVVDLLQNETEGNPLFVQMAAESLVEAGAVRRQGEGWITDETRLGEIVFPRSVTDAIALRLSRLEFPERILLEALAVCEKPVGEELLASVLRACGEGEAVVRMAGSIETLTRRRLIARVLHDDGALRLRIDHVRIRDHVYESMDWERRRRLHHEIGLELEAAGASDAEVLAHHFLNSPDAARALSYAQLAGRHAMRLYAGERAATFLERALELVPPEQAEQRLFLQLQLAGAWKQARESGKAIEAYERVLRGAKAAGRKEIAFEATGDLVDALWRAGRHDEAQRAAERHLAALRAEGDKQNQAMCLTILGNIAGGRGQMAECRRFNEEALALHQAVGDRQGAASNLNNLGLIDLVEGPTDQGRARLEEALALHRELSDLQRATEVVGNLGSWHRMRGEYEQAARRLEEAAEMARSHRDRWLLAHFEPNLAGTWHALAVMDRALESARRAVASALAIGDEARQCEGLDYQGMIERDLGRPSEAIACHEKAVTLARKIGDVSQEGYALTSLALDRLWGAPESAGDSDQKAARDLLRRAGKLIPATASARLRARLLEASTRLALSTGDVEAAALEAGRMLEVATRSSLPDYGARARLLMALCHTAQGDDKNAVAQAGQSAAQAAAGGLVETLWQAHALLAAREQKEGRRAAERDHLGLAATAIQSAADRIQDEQVKLAWLAEPRRADLLRRAAAAGVLPAGNPQGAPGETSDAPGPSGALSAIYEITEVISSMQDLDAMLARLLDLGLGIVGAERGLIILRDEATGDQKVRAARELESETIADALAYSHSVVQEASSGQVIVALDVPHDERFRNFRSVSLYAIKSLLCVPMRFRGKILGTVYVDSRRAGVLFSEQDLRFMEAFANLAASALEQARMSERLTTENVYLQREAQERHSYQNIIGKNIKMQAVYDMMERVAASHLPVLIQGESGTGKELVARALHYASPRRQRKFLSENVAAIPDSLLESEMFGHVRGAFTGADRDRQGLFEQADGGTLFLDEIGDMSLPMQAKLLRALQEGEIRPVGGKESRKVNVRIISATNKDLDRMLKEGRFREDLYYRLNVVRIPLPSLRERKEDIPMLVEHFLSRASRDNGKPARRMEVGALQLLLRYSWPGNVRELENEIQRLAVLSEGEIITQRDIIECGDLYEKITSLDQKDVFAPLDQMERRQIEKALVEAAGNRARAAELLGISRATIFRKLRLYNISH